MYNTILVALDGSEYANKALDAACEITRTNKAKLHLVHASELHPLIVGSASVMSVVPKGELRKQGTKILDAGVTRAGTADCPVAQVHNVLSGEPPVKAILSVADEISADLIVVGSLGHSDIAGLLLGSVSHRICHLAKCACLVVR